ncbi:MAG: zf-HC2 domain-containing protein [Candidatus Latescibacteria bacterium]|nr:zf-HC2 domain-containing protein [Candidatus Latescibacterota bacterium]
MNCERIESLMVDFLYGEMSDEMSKEFIKHLSECDNCSRNFNELRQVRTLLGKIPEISDQSLNWQTPGENHRKKNNHLRWYFAAAAVLVLTALSLFVALNTSIQYRQGVIVLRFGTNAQPVLTEAEEKTTEPAISSGDVEKLIQYINYLEEKQNAERIIISDQLENLASTTMYELKKRDQIIQLLASYSNLNAEPASLQER